MLTTASWKWHSMISQVLCQTLSSEFSPPCSPVTFASTNSVWISVPVILCFHMAFEQQMQGIRVDSDMLLYEYVEKVYVLNLIFIILYYTLHQAVEELIIYCLLSSQISSTYYLIFATSFNRKLSSSGSNIIIKIVKKFLQMQCLFSISVLEMV